MPIHRADGSVIEATPALPAARPSGPNVVVQTVLIPGPRGPEGPPGPEGPQGPPGEDGGGGGGDLPEATLANSVFQRPVGGDVFLAPLTYDQISAAFALTLQSSALVQVGSTLINPSFTALRNYPAVSAHLTNSRNSEDVNVLTLFNAGGSTANPNVSTTSSSFASAQSYTFPTYGDVVTFTLTVTTVTANKTATATRTAAQKVFRGVATPPGFFTEAFIESLTGILATTKNGTYSFTAGPGQKFYLAYRSAYGASNFNIGGFDGGASLVASGISVTNSDGFTENYDIYATDTANLGATNMVVS